MSTITPIQFLQALYPEPVGPGQLVLWTQSRKRGVCRSHWTLNLDEAARKGMSWRRSRDVYFSVALHDQAQALAMARQRRPRIGAGWVRGSESSATLLPALWIDLEVADPRSARSDLPPDREAALGLLDSIAKQPSILVRTGDSFQAYWLLDDPLILDSRSTRAAAKGLLSKLQWAVRATAAEQGWWVRPTASLAQVLRLPETLNHRSRPIGSPGLAVTIEQFPLQRHLGKFRYRPGDFAGLREPTSTSDVPDELLRDLEDRDPRGPRGLGPTADFRPIYQGCPWLRRCYQDRSSLGLAESDALVDLISRCRYGAADGRRLTHSFSRDQPGYTVADTDSRIDHALHSAEPPTCDEISLLSGAEVDDCSRCPQAGQIRSPIELGQPSVATLTMAVPAPVELVATESPQAESPRTEPAQTEPVQTEPAQTEPAQTVAQRPEILITTDEHRVNDQVLAALIRGEANLYQHGGLLVQVVRPAGGEPAIVKPLSEAGLREIAARCCAFVKPWASGPRPAHPPRWTLRALLQRGAWPGLPVLADGVEGPAPSDRVGLLKEIA